VFSLARQAARVIHSGRAVSSFLYFHAEGYLSCCRRRKAGKGALVKSDSVERDSFFEVHRHTKSLRAKLLAIVGNPPDADDLIQDAYIRFIELQRDNVVIESPVAYVRKIAINLALDYLRRNHRSNAIFISSKDVDVVLNQPSADCGPEHRCLHAETLSRVMECLKDLPPKCRRAFILSQFKEYTHAQVSNEIGLSVSMVEKYCKRALQHVRTKVKNN
jgi:RNA polymerase sigma factor (sigma-70 family)